MYISFIFRVGELGILVFIACMLRWVRNLIMYQLIIIYWNFNFDLA